MKEGEELKTLLAWFFFFLFPSVVLCEARCPDFFFRPSVHYFDDPLFFA